MVVAMMMRVIPFIAVFLLIAGSGRAEPGVIELDSAAVSLIEGDLHASVRAGTLNLSAPSPAVHSVILEVLSADGRRVTHTATDNPVVSVTNDRSSEDRITLRAGTLRVDACKDDCQIFVFPVGPSSHLDLSARVSVPLRFAEHRSLQCGYSCASTDFVHTSEAGASEFVSAPGALDRMNDPRVTGSGQLVLLLRNVAATFTSSDGRRVLDARTEERGSALGLSKEVDYKFIVLTIDVKRVELAPDVPFTLSLEGGSLDLDGRVALAHATGRATFRGGSQEFKDVDIGVRGDDLEFALSPGSSVLPVGEDQVAAGSIRGDVEVLAVGGAGVQRATASREAVAAVTGAAALFAIFAAAARWLVLPFYSRIVGARVLENTNRERLFALVTSSRSVTVAQLRTATGLARVVITHHLRMLEAHKLITSRVAGARRVYFRVEAAPTPAEFAARTVLDDPTRKRIADLILARGGATQRELCEATGLAQRLVSYHLAKLEAAGLVKVEAGLPKTYHASGRVAA